jgi:hypothetical protein
MKTKYAILIALATGCLGFAAGDGDLIRVPHRTLGESALLIGELGQPIGEVVTIRGRLSRDMKDGDFFVISELNGKLFDGSLPIRGTKAWPDDTEATLVGYEEAVISYLRQLRSSPPDAPPFTPHQFAFNTFVPIEILGATDLELSNEEAKVSRSTKRAERKPQRGGSQ